MQNTADRLEAELVDLSSRMNAAEYQMLKRIRELEDAICLIDWTYPQWLAWRLNMAPKTAFERVRVARALGSPGGDWGYGERGQSPRGDWGPENSP